jgi:transcriptional regulator with XRE-family HTH domain
MKHHQLKKDVGTRLRILRKSLGFTQNKIVSHFDIGRANYSRMEKGEIFPSAAILSTLREEFNVCLDWLITGKGEMVVPDVNEEAEKLSAMVNLEEYSEEMRDLLAHMSKVPMVKHAVLGFFIEYKTRNKKLIDPIMNAGLDRHISE